MEERFARSAMLLGGEAVASLGSKRVAVFGVGGVGGHAAEALARSGIGAIDLIDGDVVSVSNLNRQVVALTSTLGRSKADIMRARILDINPGARVDARHLFYTEETAERFEPMAYDYVLDCVDMVSAKLLLAARCLVNGTPIISAMGAGNKLDPTLVRIADISRTSVCPLARVMRRELKARGIDHLTVAFSAEQPITPAAPEEPTLRRGTPGSMPFVPAAMGLTMASHVVKALLFMTES